MGLFFAMLSEDNKATTNLLKLRHVAPEKCMWTDIQADTLVTTHNFFRILFTNTLVFNGVIHRLTFSLDTV